MTGIAVRGNPAAERYSLPGYAASSYGCAGGPANFPSAVPAPGPAGSSPSENLRRELISCSFSDHRRTLLGEDRATTIGDAVVPCEMAVLEGAEVIKLEGVLHSMSKVGTWEDRSGLVWYGHEDVVDNWLGHAV